MADHGLEHVDIAVGALGREVAALPRSGVEHVAAAFRHREWRQPRQRHVAEQLGPLGLRQIELVRRQRLVDRAAARLVQRLAPRIVIVGNLGEAFARGVLALRLDRNGRAVEIIEQRVHPLLEERQPMLHAGMAPSLGDRFIELVVALGRAERRDIAHAEAADGFGGELEFGDRHQVEPAHVQMRSLGLGIEGADRLQ